MIENEKFQAKFTCKLKKPTFEVGKNTTPKEKFEMWVKNENAQYRIQNQKMKDNITITFWIPDKPIKHFNTTYTNLIKMLENADKSLYSITP